MFKLRFKLLHCCKLLSSTAINVVWIGFVLGGILVSCDGTEWCHRFTAANRFACILSAVDGHIYLGGVACEGSCRFVKYNKYEFMTAARWSFTLSTDGIIDIGASFFPSIHPPCGPGVDARYDSRIERDKNGSIQGYFFKLADTVLRITRSDAGYWFANDPKHYYFDAVGAKTVQIQIPGLLIAGAGVTIGALQTLRWRKHYIKRKRRDRGCCQNCGYDLRGNSAAVRCTECGLEITIRDRVLPASQ